MPHLNDEFAGKTAIVTGGGTGIGRATALLLASRGVNVVVAGRSSEPLEESVAMIEERGGSALAVPTDVREPEDIDALVSKTVERFGRLDIVVNNAGGTYLKLIDEIGYREWERIIQLNLSSVFLLTRAALPHLTTACGSIVNISSSSASYGTVGGAAYSAAKSGVEMFTKVAAAELSPRGVRINCVAPGLIRSPGAERGWTKGGLDIEATEARLPLRRVGEPEDIARIVVFLSSGDAAYLTGEVIHADGGPQMDGIQLS